MDSWNWVWMTTTMVVFWGAVAAVVITLIRRTSPTQAAPRDTPDEYRQRLDALELPTER